MKPWFFLLLLWLLASHVLADEAHNQWTDRYTNAVGVRCCNGRDCRPADVYLVSEARGEVWVNDLLLTLPPASMHRMPEDADVPASVSGYLCLRFPEDPVSAANIRCLFYRPANW
jgi:hypothetical protein